jgi:hypothetical protein
MRKRWMVLTAMVAAVAIASGAEAGGRARVRVSQAPRRVVAGQSFEVAIQVIPQTWSHARNVEPLLTAECGARKVTFATKAEARPNQYRASLTLPSAGNWTILVDSRYCQTVMTPISVEAIPEEPAKSAKLPG